MILLRTPLRARYWASMHGDTSVFRTRLALDFGIGARQMQIKCEEKGAINNNVPLVFSVT